MAMAPLSFLAVNEIENIIRLLFPFLIYDYLKPFNNFAFCEKNQSKGGVSDDHYNSQNICYFEKGDLLYILSLYAYDNVHIVLGLLTAD